MVAITDTEPLAKRRKADHDATARTPTASALTDLLQQLSKQLLGAVSNSTSKLQSQLDSAVIDQAGLAEPAAETLRELLDVQKQAEQSQHGWDFTSPPSPSHHNRETPLGPCSAWHGRPEAGRWCADAAADEGHLQERRRLLDSMLRDLQVLKRA